MSFSFATLALLVSIPYWCDWKCLRSHFASPTTAFQFLIGAIGRGTCSICTKMNLKVSIPYWCDWKHQATSIFLRLHLFQFLIGAIGS